MPHLANWLLHSGHWQVYGFSPEQDFTVSIRNTGASTRTRKLSNFAPDLIRTTLCHHTAIILAKSNLIKPFLKSSQCQFLQHVSIWRAQVEQCFPVQSNAKSLSFYPTILILFITTAWAIFWSSFPNTISPNSLQSSFFSTILQEHDHKLQDSCSSFSYMSMHRFSDVLGHKKGIYFPCNPPPPKSESVHFSPFLTSFLCLSAFSSLINGHKSCPGTSTTSL